MCFMLAPAAATAAYGAFSAASSLASTLIGNSAASAEHKAAVQLGNEQAAAANEGAIRSYAALGRRESEEAAAAAADITATTAAAKDAAGTAAASASANGVTGRSIDEITRDYERQAALSAGATLYNFRAVQGQLSNERFATHRRLRAELVGATPPPERTQSVLPGLLGAVGQTAAFGANVGLFKNEG